VKHAPVPAISGEDLVATVPEIEKVARVEVQNLSNVPSDYMDPDRWVQLQKAVSEALARPEVAGVIVSHGTDTLEETAWFLDLTVDSEKPIVLIGAQRNASEKDFDGPRNLLNAARICVAPSARGKGAMIALNNQINAAREAVKTHTSDVETFKSGDFGFLGVADYDRVIFYRAPLRRQHLPLKGGSGRRGEGHRHPGPRLGQHEHPHVRGGEGGRRQTDSGGDHHARVERPRAPKLRLPGRREDPAGGGRDLRRQPLAAESADPPHARAADHQGRAGDPAAVRQVAWLENGFHKRRYGHERSR
jgi:hypothetical protein